MTDEKNNLKTSYLVFITFLAIIAVFPLMVDLLITAFFGDFFFFTPTPDDHSRTWLIILSGITLAVLIVFQVKKRNQTEKLEFICVSVLRYVLIFAMVAFYGYAKLLNKQFQINYSALETPLKDVPSFHLTWYFFGRSNFQALLYGLVEFIPGILLFFRRTTLLGALLLLPVLGNVLLVNIFNEISWLTLRWATLLIFFDFAILLYYRTEIKQFFAYAKPKLDNSFRQFKKQRLFNVLKFIFVLLIFVRFGYGIYKTMNIPKSKCYGVYEISSVAYNDKNCSLDSLNDYWKKLYFEKRMGWNNMLKNKNDESVWMRYTFFNNKDSIKILSYKFDENGNPVDSTVFKGIYTLSNKDSILTLKGIQNDKRFTANYTKLPLDGHDWWW